MVSKYIGQSYAINFWMRLQKSERHIWEIKAVHFDKLYNFPNLLWHLYCIMIMKNTKDSHVIKMVQLCLWKQERAKQEPSGCSFWRLKALCYCAPRIYFLKYSLLVLILFEWTVVLLWKCLWMDKQLKRMYLLYSRIPFYLIWVQESLFLFLKIKNYQALKLNNCDSIQEIFKHCDKETIKALPND